MALLAVEYIGGRDDGMGTTTGKSQQPVNGMGPAERSIKPFVNGCKNFLFANTPLGAQASGVIYSLVETA